MKSFLVIGMGSFGHHLCRALVEQKCEVMAVDQNGEYLEDVLPIVVSAKVGDCTNEEVLRSFSVESFDACFVCLGDNNVLGSLQIKLPVLIFFDIIFYKLSLYAQIAVRL